MSLTEGCSPLWVRTTTPGLVATALQRHRLEDGGTAAAAAAVVVVIVVVIVVVVSVVVVVVVVVVENGGWWFRECSSSAINYDVDGMWKMNHPYEYDVQASSMLVKLN